MSTSITLSNQTFELFQFRDDFVLLRADQSAQVFAIGEAIHHRQFPFVEEVIATETEICLKLNTQLTDSNIKSLQTVKPIQSTGGRLYDIPVLFDDSEDWSLVTAYCNQSKAKIIDYLQTIEFDIAMFGFLPGFVYLNGLPSKLHVPRKSSPSLKMQPNTIAIGGPYLGIYSLPSPGGWNAIGQIAYHIFDTNHTPPMLISKGDRFRLKAVDQATYQNLQSQQLPITKLK